jgi:hypothetical protein
MARDLVGPAVSWHRPSLILWVIDMTGQIIRLSIPIATIAISSAIAFTVCWVGLALLGF